MTNHLSNYFLNELINKRIEKEGIKIEDSGALVVFTAKVVEDMLKPIRPINSDEMRMNFRISGEKARGTKRYLKYLQENYDDILGFLDNSKLFKKFYDCFEDVGYNYKTELNLKAKEYLIKIDEIKSELKMYV